LRLRHLLAHGGTARIPPLATGQQQGLLTIVLPNL